MDLKIKDVAELLNVSETTIRRWLSEEKIPAYRLNHQFRFSRIEIENWVMERKMGKSTDKNHPFSNNDSLERKVPLNSEKTKQILQKKTGTKQFSLYRALHHGEVYHNVVGENKEKLIQEAMRQSAQHFDYDADVITDLLLDRERLMPTSLNHGIAVPHTRDFLFKEPYDIINVVYPQKPIEYGALDGKPVHTLFFLFACEDKRHLNLLAKLAHLVNEEHAREFLQGKPAKESLLKFIKEWEANVQTPAYV